MKKEISTVGKSGERHPNNYYAWQYLRRLLGYLGHDFWQRNPEVFESIVGWQDGVCAWCLAHPSDVSGWSFLVYLVGIARPSPPATLVKAVVDKALDFAERIQWRGPGVWLFINNAPDWATGPHEERIKALLKEE